MSELFDGVELNISQDGLQTLMKKILNRYKRYLISNGLLNLDKIGFSSYMQTEEMCIRDRNTRPASWCSTH